MPWFTVFKIKHHSHISTGCYTEIYIYLKKKKRVLAFQNCKHADIKGIKIEISVAEN